MSSSYVKEHLDLVDHDKFECKNSLVEGGDLGTKLESATPHFKLEPLSNGGCVVEVAATYKVLPGAVVIDETRQRGEGVTGLIKAAEGYLLANPSAYA